MAKYAADSPVVIIPSATRSQYCRLLRVGPGANPQVLAGQLPFPFLGYGVNRGHAVSARWVVGVRPGPLAGAAVADQVVRLRRGPTGKPVPLPDVEMPRRQQVKCLLLHGDWLYIGGAYDHRRAWDQQTGPNGELFHRFNLNEEAPVLEPVPLPVAFGPGKAIDDLLQDGNELLVVDDVVFPKYLFFYQLQAGSALPKWQRTHLLPFRRVYEHIERAAWNAQFIALLSTSTGMGGTGRYVSILRRSDLKPLFIASWHHVRPYWASSPVNNPNWHLNDLALQDNDLVLACGSRGLACLRLDAVHLWPKRRTSYTTWDSTSVGGRLGATGPRRGRETVLADPLGLDTAGTAAGVRWVRLADGLPPVESVCFVGPGLLLLTGRHKRLGPATVWLQPLLPDGRPAPAVLA